MDPASRVHTFPAPVADSARVLFEQTVPRHLVHRAAVSEVFLTDVKATSEATFQVAAQWPRDHAFYRLTSMPYHDSMLLAETLRQASLVLAHTMFEIPLGWQFLSHEKSYRITEDGLALNSKPADVLLSVSCHDIKWRSNRVGGMRMSYDVYRDGTLIGAAHARWSCVSPASYERLRAQRGRPTTLPESLPAPVNPRLVGREYDRDVVLAPFPEDDAWLLRADRTHPVLFDHPVDHVPGMVLFEAARQAAKLTLGDARLQPVSCDFDFLQYVESHRPTIVRSETIATSEDDRQNTVRVSFHQDGREVAVGAVRLQQVAVAGLAAGAAR